jgi:5-methylcytosine-specific restriction protein A
MNAMADKIPTYRPPGLPRAPAEASRGNSAQRGYDRRWRNYRTVFLAANPWCVECLKEGRTVRAQHVDHKTPVKSGQDDPGFWAENNHQALCASCHSAKTAREKGRI